MGLSKKDVERRQATFDVLNGGVEAFVSLRARLKRNAIAYSRSMASLIRDKGLDPKAWQEIEFVLEVAGVDLHKLTRLEAAKLDLE